MVAVPRPLAVAAGLIGSLALWWWSTRPVEVAAVNVAAVALSANPVPAVVALYTLAASRRAALPLAAISGAAVVAFAVPEWVDAGKLSVSPLVGGFFATLVAVGAGLYVRTRHDLVRSLRDRAEAAEAARAAGRAGATGRAGPHRPGDARRPRPLGSR